MCQGFNHFSVFVHCVCILRWPNYPPAAYKGLLYVFGFFEACVACWCDNAVVVMIIIIIIDI